MASIQEKIRGSEDISPFLYFTRHLDPAKTKIKTRRVESDFVAILLNLIRQFDSLI